MAREHAYVVVLQMPPLHAAYEVVGNYGDKFTSVSNFSLLLTL